MNFTVHSQIYNFDYIQTTELSQFTNNSAMVVNDSLKNYMLFEFNPEFKRGNLNKPREPKGYNKYRVFTKGVREVNGVIFTGNLEYAKIHDLDRKWCNVYDYNTRFPYYPFDTVAGDWHKSDLFLSAGITKPFLMNKISVSLASSYWLTTGAKQKDPRALTRNNEINLSPSLIYHVNDHNWLGINVKWNVGKETSEQNFFKQHSNDKVFGLTGLGSLTVSGMSKRFFKKNGCSPELLFVKRRDNTNYMIKLYYDYHNISSFIKWYNKPKAESVINEYDTYKIGGELVYNKRINDFAHFLLFNASYIMGKGKSISSNGTTEHTGIAYENNTLLPYHSDASINGKLSYSFFKLTDAYIDYKIMGDVEFDRTEIKYTGGIDNSISVNSLLGKLSCEKLIFKQKGIAVSLNAHSTYYYPIDNQLVMKTTFTSSDYAKRQYEYLTCDVFGYGLGINVLSVIDKKDYNFIFSYSDKISNNSELENRHLFSAKIITYF